MDLTIEKLVYGGEGLARVNGEVVFTPFVLPGEKVVAERLPSRKGAVRARLVDVLESSNERTNPICPVFTQCGGCQYQHIDYAAQVRLKRGILAETLRRVGGIEIDPERIQTIVGEPWGYRNRVQFHFENGTVGYRAMGSRRLVRAAECPIASPKINEVLGKLTQMVSDRRWPRFLQSLEVFTDEHQVQWNVLETEKALARHFFDWLASEVPGTVDGALRYAVGEDLFQVSGQSFFQVNRFLLPALVEAVTEGAQGKTAWDLYAGVGLFSIPLARRFENVFAVESGRSAVRDLAVNAASANVQISTEEQDTDTFLESASGEIGFVLADPPRQGLGKTAVARLLHLKPETLVVVACDPATLGRDLAGLQAGFEIDQITMVDLFPQTFHMETVVRLKRK